MFALEEVWKAYEEWSAYGAEVPLHVQAGPHQYQDIIQCYVPYLSGMQLYEADSVTARNCNRVSDKGVSTTTPIPHLPIPERDGLSSATGSTASSATSGDSDSEGDCRSPKNPLAAGLRNKSNSSILHKQQSLGEPNRLLFQYFETEGPHLRAPLAQRIEELGLSFPGLFSTTTDELHPASWFAVAWYPIQRIPTVTDPAVARDLQASFLTFHSLAVPELRGGAGLSPGGCPVPPPLCPPGAAVMAYRTECARQQAVTSALSTMLAATSDTDESVPSDRNCTMMQDLPQNVHCLSPWAFMPYKAGGRLWSDPANRCRQHLPMIAAGQAWVERRGVHLPDLEFFKRSQQELLGRRY